MHGACWIDPELSSGHAPVVFATSMTVKSTHASRDACGSWFLPLNRHGLYAALPLRSAVPPCVFLVLCLTEGVSPTQLDCQLYVKYKDMKITAPHRSSIWTARKGNRREKSGCATCHRGNVVTDQGKVPTEPFPSLSFSALETLAFPIDSMLSVKGACPSYRRVSRFTCTSAPLGRRRLPALFLTNQREDALQTPSAVCGIVR